MRQALASKETELVTLRAKVDDLTSTVREMELQLESSKASSESALLEQQARAEQEARCGPR